MGDRYAFDAIKITEVPDGLAPGGPLWTACARADALACTTVLAYINAAVAGVAGIAALGVT